MKKLLFLFAVLCGTVSAWAGVTPTEQLKASTILPSMGIPENQYYVLQTKDGGEYWNSATANTDKNGAGKFAFYAVPGLEDCYYIYSITAGKWITYNKTNRNNQKSFVQSADNFDANAYWKITSATKKNGGACYQMQPTVYTTNQAGILGIKTDRYANWYQGTDGSPTLGLWEQAPSVDEGSAWSLIPVDVTEQLDVILSQRIAVANEILSSQAVYTKGSDILNAGNVTSIISSPFTSAKEGSIAKLVDDNAGSDNHWHSDYSAGDKINGSHYIVANLGESTPTLLSFDYARRKDVGNDHTTRWAVYGVPSDETNITANSRDGLTLLAIISTPYTSHSESFENLPPFKTQGFKKFRIYSEATNQNRGYFHIGELQLNDNTIADSNTDNIKELAAAVAEAEALETVTQEDIDNLNAKISGFVLSDEDKARVQEVLNLTGVGYPATNSVARIALQNFLNNPASLAADLESAIAAYKTSTDVTLPVSGKAYQFAFVANDNDLTNYKVVANGTGLSVSADAEATTFYCVKYTNVNGSERYAFVSPEGNFLGYHVLSENYRTHVDADKRLQNDISFASMLSFTSNINSGTEEKRFGTVAMNVDNRIIENPNLNGYFILNFSAQNKSFDKSSAPYFNGNYTSAIKVTEVTTYEPSDKVLLAASTINPLIQGYIRIGEGLGKYSYTYGENSGNAFVDFETLVNSASTVITNADYSFAINLPTAGFYRIKSMNGNDANKRNKYIQTADNVLALTTTKDVNSIVYLDEDNMIISYAMGVYLNTYKDVADKGSEGSAWTFLENRDVIGAYAFDNPADKQGGEQYFLSDWTGGVTYGGNDANAAWTFEPVEELPFTFNADACGYATFHAPVAVELPDGVNAYIGKIDGNKLKMRKFDKGKIPANTAVLLYNSDYANTPEVSLSIIETTGYTQDVLDDIDAKDDFVGTVAAEDLDGTKDCYSLQKSTATEGESAGKMGFFKKTYDTKGGFKAWLEITKSASNARAFTIIFDGDDATGLKEALGLENENVEIYDLSGRRLDKPAKGVNVIGGKLVVK